jgi:hypothetical protein
LSLQNVFRTTADSKTYWLNAIVLFRGSFFDKVIIPFSKIERARVELCCDLFKKGAFQHNM